MSSNTKSISTWETLMDEYLGAKSYGSTFGGEYNPSGPESLASTDNEGNQSPITYRDYYFYYGQHLFDQNAPINVFDGDYTHNVANSQYDLWDIVKSNLPYDRFYDEEEILGQYENGIDEIIEKIVRPVKDVIGSIDPDRVKNLSEEQKEYGVIVVASEEDFFDILEDALSEWREYLRNDDPQTYLENYSDPDAEYDRYIDWKMGI